VNNPHAKSAIYRRIPSPAGSGYLDRVTYRSVHFHGVRAADVLAEAAEYLREVEQRTHRPPFTLCVHVQFSWEDDGSDLAWQATIVLSDTAVVDDKN
jgi:hypothetical protein